MFDKTIMRLLFAAALLASAVSAKADVFNMGGTQNPRRDMDGLGEPAIRDRGQPDGQRGRSSHRQRSTVGSLRLPDGQIRRDGRPVRRFLTPWPRRATPMACTTCMGTDLADSRHFPNRQFRELQLLGHRAAPARQQHAGLRRYLGRCGPVLQLAAKRPADQREPRTRRTTETGAYTLNGGTSDARLMAVTRKRDVPPTSSHGKRMVQGGVLRPDLERRRRWLLGLSDQEQHRAEQLAARHTSNNANYYISNYTDPTNFLTPVGDFVLSPGPLWDVRHGRRCLAVERDGHLRVERGLRGGSVRDY